VAELAATKVANEYNTKEVVENIRNLAEYLVYSEKFGKDFFE